MGALSTGHMAVDFAGGALPALLPFFKDRFGLSYTLVAVLLLESSIPSSVIQPLFGLWSDRRRPRLRPRRPARRRQRARHGGLPSRRLEVRRLRERRPPC